MINLIRMFSLLMYIDNVFMFLEFSCQVNIMLHHIWWLWFITHHWCIHFLWFHIIKFIKVWFIVLVLFLLLLLSIRLILLRWYFSMKFLSLLYLFLFLFNFILLIIMNLFRMLFILMNINNIFPLNINNLPIIEIMMLTRLRLITHHRLIHFFWLHLIKLIKVLFIIIFIIFCLDLDVLLRLWLLFSNL